MQFSEVVQVIERNRVDLLQVQLSLSHDIAYVDEHSNGLMHYACLYGQIDIIRCLHRNGVSLDERNRFGFTPFLIAIHSGHESLVKVLIEEFGIDYRDDYKNSAKRTYVELFNFFILLLRILFCRYFDLTAMELASLRGHSAICAYLIQRGHKRPNELACEGHIKIQRRPTQLCLTRRR